MPKNYDQNCPIAWTAGLIGERWTSLIVRDLLLGKTTFSELAASTGASTNTLSSRLRDLELEGIVERHQYQEHPARFEYELTDKGRKLHRLIGAMYAYGMNYGGVSPSYAFAHEECGSPVEPEWYCETCARAVGEREVVRAQRMLKPARRRSRRAS